MLPKGQKVRVKKDGREGVITNSLFLDGINLQTLEYSYHYNYSVQFDKGYPECFDESELEIVA